jgi:hypothetical protein
LAITVFDIGWAYARIWLSPCLLLNVLILRYHKVVNIRFQLSECLITTLALVWPWSTSLWVVLDINPLVMKALKCILLNCFRRETLSHHSLHTGHAVVNNVQLFCKKVDWKMDLDFIILFRNFILSSDIV